MQGCVTCRRDRLPEVVATLNASVGVLLLALGKGLTPRRASRSWEGGNEEKAAVRGKWLSALRQRQ